MQKLSFAVLSLTACLGFSPAAPTGYFVEVDTSTINGQTGNLDFLVTPAGPDALGLQARISLFDGFGGTLGAAVITGSADGVLPGDLTLDNSTAFANIFQAFQFSDRLRFAVTFSGDALMPAAATTSGSRFSFSLYAADGVTPLLTDDPTGSVAYFDITPTGAIEIATPLAQVQPIPEPASFLLVAGAGLAIALRRRNT